MYVLSHGLNGVVEPLTFSSTKQIIDMCDEDAAKLPTHHQDKQSMLDAGPDPVIVSQGFVELLAPSSASIFSTINRAKCSEKIMWKFQEEVALAA